MLFYTSRLLMLLVSLIASQIFFFTELRRKSRRNGGSARLPNDNDGTLEHYRIHQRRNLSNNPSDYTDPKSVEKKHEVKEPSSSESISEGWQFPLSASQMTRPINILAFGGSVTWGAKMKDHTLNYVKILTPYPDQADNLAMRATGADYPSLCMESMIPFATEKNYDLILFDFVINNTDGFPLLLKRLRERYPDAILVYVHIWSLVHLMVEEGTGRRPNEIPRKEWNSINWVWKDGDTFQSSAPKLCGREVCGLDEMSKLVADVGGHIYFMPRPPQLTPHNMIGLGWFGPDLHHLTEVGHQVLADGILQLLYPLQSQLFSAKRLGSFGHGDQCYNWFETGKVDLETKGTTLVNMLAQFSENPEDKKFVLEIDPEGGGEIYFTSKFEIYVPIGLGYMSQSEPRNYPIVEITANNNQPPIVIDPNKNKSFRGHPHITAFSHVGWAKPGDNIIGIKPIEKTKSPLRVIGVYICGVCAETGDLGAGSQNKLEPSAYVKSISIQKGY